MLNLPNLRNLLSQVVSLPTLHTVVLFTPEGQLISYVADPYSSKDYVRVIIGLSVECWQECKGQGAGMVDSELGRLFVLPIESRRDPAENEPTVTNRQPVMLLALNAENSVSWEELSVKGQELVKHLEKPLSDLHERMGASRLITSLRSEHTR